MPEYLATARNAEGKKVTERVEVGSADEAVRVLRDRGYDEIVLHTDDVGAHYTQQSKVDSVISPRQYLLFRRLPSRLAGFLIVTGAIYRKNWIWYLATVALLAIRSSQGQNRGVLAKGFTREAITIGLIVYLLLPVVFGLISQLSRGVAGQYNQLIEAVAWGRWDEVLAMADGVGGGIPPEEIAFQKAKALAGLGRLDEGLRLVEPFGDGKKMPDWMYWSRVAEVYATARRLDDAKATMEKALGLAPNNATLLIDIAGSEIWLRRNPRRARELLAKAQGHAISDVLRPFVMKTEGLIQLEENHPREAREILEEALQKASVYRHASPLMEAALDKMHAALALALAAEGDIDAARRHYELAKPRFLALKQEDQLARCEKAIGITQEV